MPCASNAPPLRGAFPGVLLLQAAGTVPLQLGLRLPGWVAHTFFTYVCKACEEGGQGTEVRVQRLQAGPKTTIKRPEVSLWEGDNAPCHVIIFSLLCSTFTGSTLTPLPCQGATLPISPPAQLQQASKATSP